MSIFLFLGFAGLILAAIAVVAGDVVDGLFNLDFLDSDLFSLSALSAFVGAFGFGGALALNLTGLYLIAVIAGIAAGGLAAWGAISLTRWLKSSESSNTLKSESLIGASGKVITEIPADGFGEIRLDFAGHIIKRSARAQQPIATGEEVWVAEILSPTAVLVAPAHELEPPTN